MVVEAKAHQRTLRRLEHRSAVHQIEPLAPIQTDCDNARRDHFRDLGRLGEIVNVHSFGVAMLRVSSWSLGTAGLLATELMFCTPTT
jgi:hypothetical protein